MRSSAVRGAQRGLAWRGGDPGTKGWPPLARREPLQPGAEEGRQVYTIL